MATISVITALSLMSATLLRISEATATRAFRPLAALKSVAKRTPMLTSES